MRIKCKECLKTKNRYLTFSKAGHHIYRASNGKCWQGMLCPDCVKESKQVKELPNPITKRLCNACNKPLRANRYFNHEECVTEIEYSNEFAEFIYETVGVPVYSKKRIA